MRTFRSALCILLTAALAGCQTLGLALLNAASPRVRSETGLEYAPGPRGRLDVYRPSPGASPAPLVVFWYGGGFVQGERSDYRVVGATLASRGFVAVVPDYRLYPEVGFPAFLEDAARAVARSQQEAGRWGADPCRIVLMGHSAGAYIAGMLAAEPRFLLDAGVDPACIRGWVSLSGPHDLEPNSAALHAIFTQRASPAEFKPLRRVSSATAPALLVHGGVDTTVLPVHSQRMNEALLVHGVESELALFPDRRHVDTVVALSRPGSFRIPDLRDRIAAFIIRVTSR